MRITNTTTIPNATVREVIRFVRPSGVSGFDVMLKNSTDSDLKGSAYTQGSGYHATAAPFVSLLVGAESRFPQKPQPPVRSNYLPRPYLASRLDALVYLAAHELRHLWQAKVTHGYRVWGARGKFSERDADAYAIKMLRAWRRGR